MSKEVRKRKGRGYGKVGNKQRNVEKRRGERTRRR
jgi:hypothetical protein